MNPNEHLYCGTPDCCQECDTATPEVNLQEEAAIQLELFPPEKNLKKDTKDNTLSFPLEKKEVID